MARAKSTAKARIWSVTFIEEKGSRARIAERFYRVRVQSFPQQPLPLGKLVNWPQQGGEQDVARQ